MKRDIGLDSRMIRHTGIGTYVRGLLSGFEQMGPALPRPVKPVVFEAPIYSLSEQAAYSQWLKPYRLWHAPHYNIPYFKGKTRLVVTVHDLIHWIYRKFYGPLQVLYVKTMMNRVVQTADAVIAVSEHTKADLVRHFNARLEKISVVYEGVSPDFKPCKNSKEVQQVRQKYGLPDRYFLYVGLLKPHKNVLWLADLMERARGAGRLKAPLVLVGKKDAGYPKGYERLLTLGQEEGTIHVSYVEEGDLPKLYQGAVALGQIPPW